MADDEGVPFLPEVNTVLDKPTYQNHGSSEALLRVIQERSEDIERVTICPPGWGLTLNGTPASPPMPFFTMILHFADQRAVIRQEDAEIVLNDGILNRMGIKIEFAGGKA